MIVVMHPTEWIVNLDGVPCRLWRGVTRDGRVVDVYVHRVGTADPEVQPVFDQLLTQVDPPSEFDAAKGGGK